MAGVGNDIFSGLITIDRSLIQFGSLADIMKFNDARFGWHSLRGAIINSIDKEGNLNFLKDSKEKIDAIPIFEPFAWFIREHAREGFPDDITFVHQVILDDRYLPHTEHDRAQIAIRLTDYKKGSISDELIIRAVLVAVPPPAPPPPPISSDPHTDAVEIPPDPPQLAGEPERAIMRQLGQFTLRAGEDKFIDHLYAGTRSLNNSGREYGSTPPVGGGKIGKLGDIVIIDRGDKLGTTEDGDDYGYGNIRHDAHFGWVEPGQEEVDDEYDGRIYFTKTAPGTEPDGKAIKGEMVCDPAVANTKTVLNKESGEWRPQIKLPLQYGEPWLKPETPGGPIPPIGPYPPGEGVGWDVPGETTRGRMPVTEYPHDRPAGISSNDFWLPKPQTDSAVCPLQFVGEFVTPIPQGELLVANTAIFRFNIYVFRDGDTAEIASIVKHGYFEVPIAASESNNIVICKDLDLDARMLESLDMVVVYFWRDWADARDAANYSVYCKGAGGYVGPPAAAGNCYNCFAEDESEEIIAYPINA